MYLEQAKMLFPKMANDEWLIIIKGIFAFMRREKMGSSEPQSKQKIADIKNQYIKDTMFYTKPIEEVAKEIASE